MLRRDFLSAGMRGVAVASIGAFHVAEGQKLSYAPPLSKPAHVTLRITNVSHEVAPGKVYKTTAYNGTVPGPLIRLREAVPVDVHIINETEMPEYAHWHGLNVPMEIDGTQEEGSLVVPARGELRYSLIPYPAGTRYVHSHAMSGMHLDCGTYSGQFGFVYVERRGVVLILDSDLRQREQPSVVGEALIR